MANGEQTDSTTPDEKEGENNTGPQIEETHADDEATNTQVV